MIDTDAFWRQVEKAEGCWTWKGRKTTRGYGQVWNGKIWTGSHRAAYEIAIGEIPAGMLICHRCDNPICVRPDHLFPGTPQDNVDDMMAKGRARLVGRPRANKTHCPNGHEFTEKNTAHWGSSGARQCRKCNSAAVMRSRAKAATWR